MTPDPRLLANLDRVRSLPAKGRFLLVDSGLSMLTLYQDGQLWALSKAVEWGSLEDRDELSDRRIVDAGP
jgi:hypothetical protein